MIHIQTRSTLPDVIYEMSLSKRIPDAETLDDFVRWYPEHATALTEFAIALAVDALEHSADSLDDRTRSDVVSPVVSRIMSQFQNRLFDLSERRATANNRDPRIPNSNPFDALDRHAFRSLASQLDVSTVLLAKLRDRQIEPETIPQGFCRRLAQAMREDLPVLSAHLFGQPEGVSLRQFYKATGKPNPTIRQSFESAVRGSGLSDTQQSSLLSSGD